MTRCSALLVLAAAIALPGCSTVAGGPPRMSAIIAKDERLETLKTAIRSDCLTIPDDVAAANMDRRNRMVLAYMLATDEAYYVFEQRMLQEGRTGNFVATIASLGLATAGGVAGGKTARVLSAANVGVIGEREAFNKEFLFNLTVPALQNQMRASRAAVRTRIYDRLDDGTDAWPTCIALQDLAEYEQAGTLVGALTGLNETTATSKMLAETQAEAAIERLKFDATPIGQALDDYLDADGDTALQDSRFLTASSVLNAQVPTPPANLSSAEFFGRVTGTASYPAQKQALIAGIIKVEKDAAARAKLIAALR